MGWRGFRTSPWQALAGAGVALAAAIAGRAHASAWLFGVLLLIAWGLLAHALSFLPVPRPLRLLITATALALAVVAWDYTAPQPRVHLDTVRLRVLPSTISPGVVELAVRNSGSVPAHIVAFPVAHLAPRFTSAGDLAAGRMEAELAERLTHARRWPAAGTLVIPAAQTAHVDVDIPPSERAWYIARGEATVLVAARLRYRDRVLVRETVICLFGDPRTGQWLSCPFLNE
jgi:hypothetical protein